jgi:predicted secreted hydrolase
VSDLSIGQQVAQYARSLDPYWTNEALAQRAEKGLNAREALELLCLLCGLTNPTGNEGFAQASDELIELSNLQASAYRLHPAYREEWLFLLGHMTDENGDEYGLQWSIFRRSLSHREKGPSLENQMFISQFVLSDKERREHKQVHDLAVSAPAATYSQQPFVLQLEHARLQSSAASSLFPLKAEIPQNSEGIGINLRLEDDGVFIPFGRNGLLSPNFGSMYDIAMIGGDGTLIYNGQARSVKGRFWWQHAWVTIALSPRISFLLRLPWSVISVLLRKAKQHPQRIAWQWFFIHFSDGTAMYLYYSRQLKTCCYVAKDNPPQCPKDAQLTTLSYTFEPSLESEIPCDLRLECRSLQLDITLKPWLSSQLVSSPIHSYREGPADVRGIKKGVPISGVGFCEAVGFGNLRTAVRQSLSSLGMPADMLEPLINRMVV